MRAGRGLRGVREEVHLADVDGAEHGALQAFRYADRERMKKVHEMTLPKALGASLLAIFVSGCGSADQRALEAMVAERLDDPPNLWVSDAVIYRDGDARMACVTARWDNQWGERQPEQQFNAWYIPRSGTWHTDNPRTPGEAGCEFYADPDWRAEATERAEEVRAEETAEFESRRQEMLDEAQRDADARAAFDAERQRAQDKRDAESNARVSAEARGLEAEYEAHERAADAALEESLRRGPVNKPPG